MKRAGRGGAVFCVGVGLLFAGSVAAAEPEVETLREVVRRLEARVDELEADGEVRRRALDEAEARIEAADRRARNQTQESAESPVGRLAHFVSKFDFRAAVAASYNFNFNNPESDPSVGFPTSTGNRNNGSTFPAVQHNTFQLDQIDLAIGKRPTPDDRAGVHLELLYGVTADPENGTDQPRIQQAYASYLAPVLGGVEVRLGRWNTPIGAEVIYVGENFNITRGVAWFYQTIHHDGLLLSGNLPEGWHWKAAVANNGMANNFDNNNGKSGLFQLGWAGENVRARATYLVEEGPLIGHFADLASASEDDLSHFLDFYVDWDVSEALSLWLNADWVHTEFGGEADTETLLLAIAGRRQLTPRLGASLRTEGALFLAPDSGIQTEGAIWVTGTLDYALTTALSLRGEVLVQHSFAQTPSNILFINGSGTAFTRDTQVIAVSQVLYLF